MTLRRADDRVHARRLDGEHWQTFGSRKREQRFDNGFGVVERLDESLVPPGADLPDQRSRAETVTYVYRGELTYRDSLGREGMVRAGAFQRVTGGRGMRHTETNTSGTHWARVFQISLRQSEAELDPGYEQKRFTAAQRRNTPCLIASPEGRKGSLCLNDDVLVYSAILGTGSHLVHELLPGRSAWLHVVSGEGSLDDLVLTEGDGIGIVGELSVSFTAEEQAEIVLVDVGDPSTDPIEDGGAA